MIKFMLFAKRKPGISRQEFIDHYNNVHVPLCLSLSTALREKAIVRRNFMHHDQIMMPPGFEGELDYDVVTESIWPDQESFNAFLGDVSDPEKMALVLEDEKNFFDQSSMRSCIVEVHETAPE